MALKGQWGTHGLQPPTLYHHQLLSHFSLSSAINSGKGRRNKMLNSNPALAAQLRATGTGPRGATSQACLSLGKGKDLAWERKENPSLSIPQMIILAPPLNPEAVPGQQSQSKHLPADASHPPHHLQSTQEPPEGGAAGTRNSCFPQSSQADTDPAQAAHCCTAASCWLGMEPHRRLHPFPRCGCAVAHRISVQGAQPSGLLLRAEPSSPSFRPQSLRANGGKNYFVNKGTL